jgi:hypothetical protein
VTILRGTELTFATASTVLKVGDVASALVAPENGERMRMLMRGAEGPIDTSIERGSQLT